MSSRDETSCLGKTHVHAIEINSNDYSKRYCRFDLLVLYSAGKV
jgi:hypothetical protein